MPTTDLQALYALADQLIDTEDASDSTIASLEKVADRIDALVADGATPRTMPIRQRGNGPKPKSNGGRITMGLDQRPLHGGEDALASAFLDGLRDAFSMGEGRSRFATLHANDDRPRLGRDADTNEAIVASARQALVASGGICSPMPVLYEQRVVSSLDRPVKDGLTSFLATRGGIKFKLPPSFAGNDAGAGVGEWTYANDVTPTSPTTKPFVRVSCVEADQTINVSAITAQLVMGEMARRFDPERVQAWFDVLATEHAALAEEKLLATIVAGSKAVTHGQVLGAAVDTLTALDQVGGMFRNRHRMAPTAQLDVIAPTWLRDQMRADLARRAPGDGTLAVADRQIAEMFAVRNVRPIWSLDYQRIDSTQGIGAALGWPSVCDVLIYNPGSWLFLDGGILDLGFFRDLTMVRTNDCGVFFETFEKAAFVAGPNESLRLRLDLCANGGYASPLDISPCVSNS